MSKDESRVAVVIFAMLAVATGVLAWAMRLDDGNGRIGPMQVMRLGGAEYVSYFLGNRLHVLDAGGKRIAQHPLAELKLTEEPTDADFTVDATGAAQAWFFEDAAPAPRIVRCDVSVERQRLESCTQVLAGPKLKTDPQSRAVHLAVDAARGRVFVADANGAVRALALDGRVLADSPPGLLFFPNRVRVAGDVLMVADNDHRRLAWLDIAADKPAFTLKREVGSIDHPQVRPDRLKVTDFVYRAPAAGTSEALWMLAVKQGQKHGDVLVFGPGLQPLARADRGGFRDPLMIQPFGDGILAADFDGVALYRIGAGGDYAGPFGDAAVTAEFAQARDRIVRARRAVAFAWMLLGAVIGVGFVLALWNRSR